MSDGGDALVLLNDSANVVGVDFHGADGSEINDGIAPLLDSIREGQETDTCLEEIINGHVTVAMVDDACSVLTAFNANRHECTSDAARAHSVTPRCGAVQGAWAAGTPRSAILSPFLREGTALTWSTTAETGARGSAMTLPT